VSPSIFGAICSGVLMDVVIFLRVFRRILVGDQCSGTFGRTKSRHWLEFISLLLHCTHAIEVLFFLILSSRRVKMAAVLNRAEPRSAEGLSHRSSSTINCRHRSPAAAASTHPHITRPLSYGRRKPPNITHRQYPIHDLCESCPPAL
jgi:hypothetical protein